jgi:hypothetical protein
MHRGAPSLRRLIFSALLPANALLLSGACSGSSVTEGDQRGGHASTGGTAGTEDHDTAGRSGSVSSSSGDTAGATSGTAGAFASTGGVNGGRNCANPGPGTCCDYDRCMTPDEAAAVLRMASGQGGAPNSSQAGAGGEAGSGGEPVMAPLCPEIQYKWLCGFYRLWRANVGWCDGRFGSGRGRTSRIR